MKRITFFLIILLFWACNVNEDVNRIVVEGKLNNIPDGELVKLVLREPESAKVVDSVEVKKEHFLLKTTYKNPLFYVLEFSSNSYPLFLAFDKPDTVIIEGDFNDLKRTYKVNGSIECELIAQLENRLGQTDSLYALYIKHKDFKAIDSIFRNQRNFNRNFVWQNPATLATIVALSQKFPNGKPILYPEADLRLFEYADSLLSIKFPDNINVSALHKFLINQKIKFIRDYKPLQTVVLNQKAVDFEIRSEKGQIYNLNDFKGQFLLLYFWASWCNDCLNSFIELQAIKKQYPEIKIVQISLDVDQSIWQKYIASEKYNWIQTCDCLGWGSPIVEKYGIRFIPSAVLIDKHGTVIAMNIPAEKLLEQLEKLLSKNTD